MPRPTVPRPAVPDPREVDPPGASGGRTAKLAVGLLAGAVVIALAAAGVLTRSADRDVVAGKAAPALASSTTAPLATTAVTTATSITAPSVPTVAITEPAAGAVLDEAVPATFTATVQPVVALTGATLLVDGAEAARGPNATLVWARPTQGNHSVAMQVALADGRSVTSTSVLITVQTRAVSPPTTVGPVVVTTRPSGPHATGTNRYTNVDDVNFRTAPSLNAHIMARLPAGTTLVALCIQHGDMLAAGGGGPHSDTFANDLWIYTSYGGNTGWVTSAVMNTGPDRDDRTRIPAC